MKFYKSSIGRYFMIFAVVPLFVVGTILTLISTRTVYRVKVDDTKEMLQGAARELVYSYELMASGWSGFRNIDGIIYAGDYRVTGDYSIVDRIKEFTGTDMSLFYHDIRIVTTLTDESGNRYINTKSTTIWNDYVQYGKDYFDESVVINGREYFGYYMPVKSDDDEIIGMGFAGLPSDDIKTTIHRLNVVAIVVCVVLCIICLIICIFVANYLLKMQNGIMNYMKEINQGNVNQKMPAWITKRKDEYGFMSRYFVELNSSLQNMIQNDALTGLYNRRAAMKYLTEYVAAANAVDGEPFTFAIGDIDFFKKVNDTYGHSCGDEVLKMISSIIGDIADEDGFAARWGGEEFVIVYKGGIKEALPKLEAVVEQIRNTSIVYEKQTVSVTMTFGILEYIAPKKTDWVITNADALLYKGKESGRNKIVS